MAVTTRFYPTFSSAGFAPTNWRGAWDDTSDADPPCLLSRTKAGTEGTTSAFESVSTNNWDIAWEQQVSDAFTAPVTFTSSDTLQWVLGVSENSGSMNAFWHVHAYITVGDSNTVRGTLLTDSIGATEFTTTLTGRGEGAKALSSVSAQIGDRLVVEIGARCQNTSTTSFNCAVALQGTGATDLTQGSTSVTTQPGWIQLVSATDPFGSPTQNVTFSRAALLAAGKTLKVNAKTETSFATAVMPLRGTVVGVNVRVTADWATTGLAAAGAALSINAKSLLVFEAAGIALAGAALPVSAPQVLPLALAALGLTGLALGANAKTLARLPVAAISFAGQVIGVAGRLSLTVAQGAVRFVARSIERTADGITGALHSLGAGR